MIEQFYLTGTVTQGQNEAESNDNVGLLHIPQTPRLERHHQMRFSVIPTTHTMQICNIVIANMY